jgi:hypothetical protein
VALMTESPLFDMAPGPAVQCPRCGRLFEAPIELDGKRLPGHVQGDPIQCVPLPGMAAITRDARARKAGRRGK